MNKIEENCLQFCESVLIFKTAEGTFKIGTTIKKKIFDKIFLLERIYQQKAREDF